MKRNLEPASLAGLAEAVLALLLSLSMLGLSNERVGLIMGVVTALAAVYTAYVTKETLLAVLVQLVKASAALAAGYGFELNPATTAAIIAIVTVVAGFYQRTQTSPLVDPSFTNLPTARVLTSSPIEATA